MDDRGRWAAYLLLWIVGLYARPCPALGLSEARQAALARQLESESAATTFDLPRLIAAVKQGRVSLRLSPNVAAIAPTTSSTTPGAQYLEPTNCELCFAAGSTVSAQVALGGQQGTLRTVEVHGSDPVLVDSLRLAGDTLGGFIEHRDDGVVLRLPPRLGHYDNLLPAQAIEFHFWTTNGGLAPGQQLALSAFGIDFEAADTGDPMFYLYNLKQRTARVREQQSLRAQAGTSAQKLYRHDLLLAPTPGTRVVVSGGAVGGNRSRRWFGRGQHSKRNTFRGPAAYGPAKKGP